MKNSLLASVTLLSASAAFGQNSIVVNQSGGAGNSAVISQSGSGNTVSINQSNTSTSDSNGQPGNRVSLRVPKGTQTTISQHSRSDGPSGPNAVELNQAGQATAIINQSSGTDANSVTVLPDEDAATPTNRSTKRRKRRQ